MNKTLLAVAAAMISLMAAFSATAEEIDYQQEYTAQTLRADFAALYSGLKSAHYDLYVHRPKSDYDALYNKMLAALNEPLSLFEAHVLFQKFAAYGNVAHARIDFPDIVYRQYREGGGRAFPIFLRIIDGGAYVAEDYSGVDGINPGDEIVAINNAPITALLGNAAKHISADTPYIAHSLLEFSFPMYLWLEWGEVAQFRVELKSEDNSSRIVEVPANSLMEARENAKRNQQRFFSLDSQARDAKMLDDGAAYLRPGPFYNAEDPEALWDNTAYIAFIDQAFESFIEKGAKTLIIDLRQNPGGDNSFSDPLVAWFAGRPFKFASSFRIKSSPEAAASNQARLDGNPGAAAGVSGLFARKYAETAPGDIFEFELDETPPRKGRRFTGNVYVLVDRHSYSNAVSVAAIIQDYGFGKVMGEKTSDMATTYGSMESFSLPSTDIKVGFPKSHIVRPSGDEISDGVTPDFIIESPIRPAKDDVVLTTAIRLICADLGNADHCP